MKIDNSRSNKRRTFRPWLITAAIFLIVIALIMWLTSRDQPSTESWRPGPGAGGPRGAALGSSVSVSVAVVRQSDLNVHFNALGTVTAFNTVNVRARVNGELVKVLFEEGQQVKAGDLLAVVDPRPFRAALAQAEGTLQQNQAQLKNAQMDLQRYQGLYAQDSIAKQTLDTQQALVNQYQGTLKTNQGQVDDARLNLQFTEIRAPISGRLGLRQVDVGNLVTSGDTTPLVVITQEQPIAVTFSLPQQQIGVLVEQLSRGSRLPVEALDRDQSAVLAEGELMTLDNQIDIATGTIKLKARFENKDGRLFPNQFVNVRMLAQTLHDVLTIPANAIQRSANGIYVYAVQDDDTVAQRFVTLGLSENEQVVVVDGLKAGERVVVEGADRLRNGMAVHIVDNTAPPREPAAGDGA